MAHEGGLREVICWLSEVLRALSLQTASARRMATLPLNEKEQELFGFLRETVQRHETGTVMRVAGGWVRDKLLGIPADDIDISLDNMTGLEFGSIVKGEITSQGDTIPGSAKKKKSSPKVAVIGLKPELGKFVETATVHCMGLSLDFLSLRSQVQVGDKLRRSGGLDDTLLSQAAEDAHLRDFTINALFYNINTGEVEDFVGVSDTQISSSFDRSSSFRVRTTSKRASFDAQMHLTESTSFKTTIRTL